jgi:hypothetical protein
VIEDRSIKGKMTINVGKGFIDRITPTALEQRVRGTGDGAGYDLARKAGRRTGELGRVAQAIDLIGISNPGGCPVLCALCKGRELRARAQSGNSGTDGTYPVFFSASQSLRSR